VFYFAGVPLQIGSIIVVIIGTAEFIRLEKSMGLTPLVTWSYLIGLNCLLFGIYLWHGQYFALSMWVLLILSLAHFLIVFPQRNFNDLAATYFGALYVGGLFSYLIRLREFHPEGWNWVLLVFLLTWANDTGAYFIGRKFGKRSLAPRLSPKKSVEGFLGGLGLAVVTALGFGYYVSAENYLVWLLLGCLTAVVGAMGDLLESAFKRLAKLKDSGNLLPGHGGLLDRIDSLLLVAPTVYYFIQFMSLQVK
ncbi:MAG: phosphatidate cytidylyltransferase, partial [Clostridia bacterium]|nr:phosphatidate cytidylyltransferase [Clostridia bacterium]